MINSRHYGSSCIIHFSIIPTGSPNNSYLYDRAMIVAGSSWHGPVCKQLAGGPRLLQLSQGEPCHCRVVGLREGSTLVDAFVDTVSGSCCHYISK